MCGSYVLGFGSGMRYVSNPIGLVERTTIIAIYKRQIKEICLRTMDHYICEFLNFYEKKNHFFAFAATHMFCRVLKHGLMYRPSSHTSFDVRLHPSGVSLPRHHD